MSDYENDRKILLLLQFKENRTPKEERRMKKLYRRYSDTNERYQDELCRDLWLGGYMTREEVKDIKDDGLQYSWIEYKVTQSGVDAIYNGRFISEYQTVQRQRFNLYLGWFGTGVGLIGGIFGISSAIYQCSSIVNSKALNTNQTIPPTPNNKIIAEDTIAIMPDTLVIDSFKYNKSDR